MGVRGLTTFINSNADVYLEKYNLHDTILVIDGNSLAAVLYKETLGPYSAFGGDYDLFAENVEKFITNLKKCKVEAIFVFDGAYEMKKATTVRKRNAMKVFAIDKVTPGHPSRDFYPFILRPVLQEILIERGIICLQSDFEADREIAAIAKRLCAPVLSNDSDFFIYDIPFIPLSSFPFYSSNSSSNNNCIQHHISCQIFHVDNFIKIIGGFKKTMLPLLATVLGNDYVSRNVFKNFYGLIKKDKNKKKTLNQRKVIALVNWMKNESFESALSKILASLPKTRRDNVKNNIKAIIDGYCNLSTTLEKYLPITDNSQLKLDVQNCSELKELVDNSCGSDNGREVAEDVQHDICSKLKELVVSSCEQNSDCEVAESGDGKEDTHDEDSDVDQVEDNNYSSVNMNEVTIPEWVLERSRICQISPQVLTILTLRIYFCVPQMEDCSMVHAGEIGIPILKVITELLLGSNSSIKYWHRYGYNTYRSITLDTMNSYSNGELPTLCTLDNISLEVRKNILLNATNTMNQSVLKSFPEDWQLLIICVIYWGNCKSNEIKSYHIHALIMMIICVNVIQLKVGVFRKLKLFEKKFGARVKYLEKLRKSANAEVNSNPGNNCIIKILSEIGVDDCLMIFQDILSYFNVDESLKQRPRIFSRNLIHNFAEFQTILDLVQTLNNILLRPFEQMKISKFYNGTFLYNIAVHFKRQKNVFTCVEKIFKKVPNLLHLYVCFYNELTQYVKYTEHSKLISNKRKKRRNKCESDNYNEIDDRGDDSVTFKDINNKFTYLQFET